MSLRVLITGGGGQVAQGVVYCLENSQLDLEIFLAGNDPYSIDLHKHKNSILMGNVNDEGYIHRLMEVILEYKIEVLIPTIDSEIMKIAKAKIEIEEKTRCIVLVGNIQSVGITSDKKRTIDFLSENGFAHPSTECLEGEGFERFLASNNFPCVIKTRFGNASKEVYVIRSKAEGSKWIGNSNFIVQEFLDPLEGEFTTGIYTDKNGVPAASCTLKRSLQYGGTQVGERIVDVKLEEPLLAMAGTLGLPYLNIQSMKVGEKLIPFEFNGRFSGTTGMISKVFNGPELYIREHVLNQQIEPVVSTLSFIASRGSYFGYFSKEDIDLLRSRG